MATIPEAKLLVISSPYAKYGVLFEAYRRYFGQNDSPVLVWQDRRTMNPSISQELIDREMENDPEAARSEWLALFREDVEQAFPLDAIEACVIPGRVELMPAPGIHYFAFTDPSGGRHDQFTVAIAHRVGEKTVIDKIHAGRPPFDPALVIAECANVLKPYSILD